MKLNTNDLKVTWGARLFLIIFFGVGVVGFVLPATDDLFQKLVPLNLIVSTIILFLFHQSWKTRHIAVFAGIAISGYLIEVFGVKTGLVFGSYSYGNALGLKILDTPLLIGVNWLILVYCIYILFPRFNQKWFYPFFGSAVLVIFDIIMEPVAIKTDMWSWAIGKIPLQNYAAWYIIATLMLFSLKLFRVNYMNRIAVWLLSIQFVFFVLLGFLL